MNGTASSELNNPMPRWWVWTFYATIVWALGYTIAYPAWPLLTAATSGASRLFEPRRRRDANWRPPRRRRAVYLDDDRGQRRCRDPGRREAAAVRHRRQVLPPSRSTACQCHGSGAAGAPGYPNLNDDDWLWGGERGARSTRRSRTASASPPIGDTRISEMPAFGDMLEPGADHARSRPMS